MKPLTTLLGCLFAAALFSQSNINQPLSVNGSGNAPDASAQLDVSASDKGMLVPRLTSAQRAAIPSPATGLLVFDTDTGSFWFFGGSWKNISALLADADNDTKIQVEESPDEDVIRFDLGGMESMVLRKNTDGHLRLELYGDTTANTFIGQNNGTDNSTGFSNTTIGANAFSLNTSGHDNTALGANALFSNTIGYSNSAAGMGALFSNTSGFKNLALGTFALTSNTDGESNTASGFRALFLNTAGNMNNANGANALHSNSTGSLNEAGGTNALFLNTSGSNNAATGANALYGNTTGSGNTGLGNAADVASGNLANATAIGHLAVVNASNKVRIGNGAVTVIEGQVDWTFPSDARFKFNVKDENVPGLAFINQLRPVTYQFDTRRFDGHLMQNLPDDMQQQRLAGQDYSKSTAQVQTGFLAQEVEEVCKKLGYEFSGLHVPESETDNYGLAYGSFVPLLVKGMQEQQAIIDAQQTKIDKVEKLEAENAALKIQLDKITAALAGAGIAVKK